MGSNGADKVTMGNEAGGPETMIEIKIKTLDAQTYALRVDKQVPVPALKEQIASVTGVVSEQQRLICRGRVLKDDQLLTAYHVEDGHTLHMVVRQPQSSDGLLNHPERDFVSGTTRCSPSGQVAPGIVVEALTMPDGDALPPEISRMMSAVLGSFGLSNVETGIEGIDIVREHGTGGSSDAGGAAQPNQVSIRGVQSDRSQNAFGFPTGVSLGSMHPPVISDSLTTISQYISHMRRDFDAIGSGEEYNTQVEDAQRTEPRNTSTSSQSGGVQGRLPAPAALAGVMMSSRDLLVEQVADCLRQLARQLENQENVTDSAARLSTQSSAWRMGFLLYNLGAFLLELGCTTIATRLGQAPSEAMVNVGPAVFINSSGPNPLMVQPLPFQSGPNFSALPVGPAQLGAGSTSTGLFPRRIDIEIRTGSPTTTPHSNNSDKRNESQTVLGRRTAGTETAGENLSNHTTLRIAGGSNFTGGSGVVRVVPIRTMVAAVPSSLSRISSDPVLGQHVSSGRWPPASGEQSEWQSPPEAAAHQQNVERRTTRAGSSSGRSRSVVIVSTGEAQHNQESGEQLSDGILRLLRDLFPGGEIHAEEMGSEGMPTSSIPDNLGTSSASPVEAELPATDEGIFLSNLLRQIIPMLPQSSTEFDSTPGEASNSEQGTGCESFVPARNSGAGTSRRRNVTDPSAPIPKRQKMD